jgi:hypothetical protein
MMKGGEDGKMQTLLDIKKPPTNSHDYRLRKSDKRRVTDGNALTYAVEMTEADLNEVWKRLPALEKAKLINDWFSGK